MPGRQLVPSIKFTVIGDTVNTASRLQGLTRGLATPRVVGDALVNALGKRLGGCGPLALSPGRTR
jgi:class 3 adenylate cyclase